MFAKSCILLKSEEYNFSEAVRRKHMDNYDIYRDIATRTDGDIYIGVVGPVRTGKSSFIKKFMELLVLPNIEDKNKLRRSVDEMPQSGDGKTIMTTQPRFVPSDAVRVNLAENVAINMRMIDCVGYLVDGALGHVENGKPRMVRTPWSSEEIPFEAAAETGTKKVIDEHSTVGVVLTTDGSFGEIERGKYVDAEERVVRELKERNKPFVIVLNSANPDSADAKKLRDALEERYGVATILLDVLNMTETQVVQVLGGILYEFPVRQIEADIPKWMRVLPREHRIITEIIEGLNSVSQSEKMSAYREYGDLFSESEYLEKPVVTALPGEGRIVCKMNAKPDVFYTILSEECGAEVGDDYKLMAYVKRMRENEEKYDKIKSALDEVEKNGYGVVAPTVDEMVLEEPVMVKQGGRFGVKLKASAPSLHIMRVDVETEVSPIVGTEQQGEDMVRYLMSEFEADPKNIWNTNMFGKSLNMLVREGLNTKLHSIPSEAQTKLRKTLSRIVNESKGGVICILL